MGGASLPPGFRFHPTDEELVGYYLKRKVEGLEIELEVIPVVDLYKFDPWELPEKSFLPQRDMEWYFFCPRDRKYPNGSRTNRATKAGYWKATGKDRRIVCQSSEVAYRKTLVFYRGRAPLGDRTDWVMHEYRLCDDDSQGSPNFQGPFALCRVIKKKTDDVHGEPKSNQLGSSSSTASFSSTRITNEPVIISDDLSFQAGYMGRESNYSSPITSPYLNAPMMEYEPAPMGPNSSTVWVSPDLILDSSKEYSQGQSQGLSGYYPQQGFPSSITSWKPYSPHEILPSSSHSNFTEEVETVDDLSRFCSISPYAGDRDYMGFFGTEDMSYEGLGETWNHAPICRQISSDGSVGEFNGLWSQEDNFIVMI